MASLIFPESICLQTQRPLVSLASQAGYETDHAFNEVKNWLTLGARWGALYRFQAERYRNEVIKCTKSSDSTTKLELSFINTMHQIYAIFVPASLASFSC